MIEKIKTHQEQCEITFDTLLTIIEDNCESDTLRCNAMNTIVKLLKINKE